MWWVGRLDYNGVWSAWRTLRSALIDDGDVLARIIRLLDYRVGRSGIPVIRLLHNGLAAQDVGDLALLVVDGPVNQSKGLVDRQGDRKEFQRVTHLE